MSLVMDLVAGGSREVLLPGAVAVDDFAAFDKRPGGILRRFLPTATRA